MTEKQYRKEIIDLSKTENFSVADNAFIERIDNLADSLRKMILDNTDDVVSLNGTAYYVSNDGNDNLDGKSPEKAIATLEKVNELELNEGDAVLFRRGDTFRGAILAKSGVSYSAYGTGPKPKIMRSYNGKDGKWEKTNKEHVWKYNITFDDGDICLITFNDGEKYAIKKRSLEEVTDDLDFTYNCKWAQNNDHSLYLYCKDGNPSDVFASIELSRPGSIIRVSLKSHDITIKNLELLYGQDPCFTGKLTKNIKFSYCTMGWSGGDYFDERLIRYGGGAGCWHSCDGFYFDHCYIYQQFDAGISPQYDHKPETDGDPDLNLFKDFKATDCLFENIEYTLEYFTTHHKQDKCGFKNLYFAYNLCRLGGYGFGDKTHRSSYIKSWNHKNTCTNCKIEYNVFDRAANLDIEIYGHAPGKKGINVDYSYIPKLSNNIYIEPKEKEFANINGVKYLFNEYSYNALSSLDVQHDDVYVFVDTEASTK